MSTFVTTSKVSDGYNWSIPAYEGRVARSESIWVKTVTAPVVSASTEFIQSGSEILNYVSGMPPSNITGSSGGFVYIQCKTNLPVLSTFDKYASDSCKLTYTGSNRVDGGTINAAISQAFDRRTIDLTFTGDPGKSASFVFFITYSYQANTSSYDRYGTIFMNSGSNMVHLILTQSGIQGTISVNPSSVVVSNKAQTGSVEVTTNDYDWVIM